MMNKALSQRVKDVMNYKRVTSTQLAKMLGVSLNAVTNWRTGNTAISHENIKKIVDLFDDIDYAWLADGKGHMVKTVVNREYCLECARKDAQLDVYKQQIALLQDRVDLLNKTLGGLEK